MSRRRKSRKAAKTTPAPVSTKIRVQPMDLFRAQDAASKEILKRAKNFPTEDGYDNFISRLGLNNDNALSAGTYEPNLVTKNRLLLEFAYRGSWVVGAVIDSVAEDMTRAGVEVTTSAKDDLDEYTKAIRRLCLWTSLEEGIKWGRLYGGGIGVMQIRGQNVKTPLNLDSITKDQFTGITVYDRWQVNPLQTPVIQSGPDIGLPAYYQIVNNPTSYDPTSNTPTGELVVHHSRVVRFIGIKLPFFQAITEMMWGESVLERLWDRLISFDNATLSSASLIDRANLRTVGIDGLREIIGIGGKAFEGLEAFFEMMRLKQVNEGLTLLDKNDTFAATPYSFAGLSDMMLQFGQQLAGASGIPLVRLFGQSPAGLNSSGDADIRMYYDNIKAQQESRLRNPLDTVLKVLWRSTFGKPTPPDFAWEFTPLWQLSAKEKADVTKTNTDAICEAHGEGLVSTPTAMKELQSMSGSGGVFSKISDEEITEAELEPAPLPDEAPVEEPKPGEKKEPEPEPKKEPAPAKDGWPALRRKWFGKAADAGNFKESDHPRNKSGEFGSGGGGGEQKTEGGKTEGGKTEGGKTEGGKTEGGKTESGEGSEKKKRKPGKLAPAEGIRLHSVNHVRELSAHGEENPETCAHCGKGIKNVATISHPDEGLVKVGLDCAEALTSGEALQVVKKEIDKSKKDAARATTFGQKEAVSKAREHLSANWSKADPAVKKQRQERLDVAEKKAAELGVESDVLIGLAGRIAYHKDGGGRTWYEHIDTAAKELADAAKKITAR